MLKEYRNTCALPIEVLSDIEMCVSKPLAPGSLLIRVVKSANVIVENNCMPVDMLVLPMSDFDVVLGNELAK